MLTSQGVNQERIWTFVHNNATRSRMWLQDYAVEVLKTFHPILPGGMDLTD